MNVPEIKSEVKGMHSESAPLVKVLEKPPIDNEPKASPEAVQKATQPSADKQQQSKAQIEKLISDVEKHLESTNVQLKFNVVEDSHTIQVEVQDSEGKTIRKIPGDDVLKLSKSLKNLERGFLDETF